MVKFFLYFHLYLIAVLFIPTRGVCQSEKIEISKKSTVFQNKRNNSFLVFDDSTYYYEFKVSSAKWAKKAYTFQSAISFNNFKNLYTPIASDNGSIYFVDKGIGEVYKLIDDTLKRIDQSFHHQNQYDGCLFTYKNVIYCFGGYGLFTFKNIFTYFDENLGEWFPLELPLKSAKPDARSHCHFQLKGDQFILFGGMYSAFEETKKFEDVWEFNFIKKKWKNLGRINRLLIPIVFQEKSNNLLHSLPKNNIKVYDLNLHKNEFKLYKSIFFSNYHQILKDTSSNNICIVFSTREDYSHVFIISYEKALSPKVSSGAIYAENTTSKKNSLIFIVLGSILFVLLSIFFFYFKMKRTSQKLNKVKFFHKQNGLYYFQNQLLEENFELLEIKLLKKFLDQPEQILELSLTLGIFEFDEASQETAKKRRENNLKSICEKIAQKSDLAQKDIFIETRNPIDKRIKLLKLHPSLIDSSINEIS
jgi:hypothetical protein